MKHFLNKWLAYIGLVTFASMYAQTAGATVLVNGSSSGSVNSVIESSVMLPVHGLTTVSDPLLVAQLTSEPQGMQNVQISPDDTLGSERSAVNTLNSESTRILIEGGANRGTNLFHSFEEFNVDVGQEVRFESSLDVENIFSRVTGQSPSTIDGLLGVVGQGNLFFLNPNGVIFGDEAQLDIDGVLTVSVDEGFAFADGSEFGAASVAGGSLLSMSVPLGVQLNIPSEQENLFSPETQSNSLFIVSPDDIEVSEQPDSDESGFIISSQFIGTLLGSDRSREAVVLKTPGNIRFQGPDNVMEEVGGSSIQDRFVTRIQNFNSATDFRVFASNIDVVNTSIGQERIFIGDKKERERIGDRQESGRIILVTPQSPDNRISIKSPRIDDEDAENQRNAGNLSELFTFYNVDQEASSNIHESIDSQNTQNMSEPFIPRSGDIILVTGALDIEKGRIVSLNALNGRSGSIDISASERIDVIDSSRVSTEIQEDTVGFTGEIRVSTDVLEVSQSSILNTSTRGQGNAGRISIVADSITLNGSGDIKTNEITLASGIFSRAEAGALGDGGEIDVNTDSLSIMNRARLTSNSLTEGDSGKITIVADGDVYLTNGGEITSRVQNEVINGEEGSEGRGSSEGIKISARDLTVSGGGEISASTFAEGDGGLVDISVDETLLVTTERDPDFGNRRAPFSRITSAVGGDGQGNSGGIRIVAGDLDIDGALVDTNTFGQGNAGLIDIEASNISLTNGAEIFSRIETPQEGPTARGDGEGIRIQTDFLSIKGGSRISSDTLAEGNAGDIEIMAREGIRVEGTRIEINDNEEEEIRFSSIASGVGAAGQRDAMGEGGDIEITTGFLELLDSAQIIASTFADGNSGEVTINSNNIIIDDRDMMGGDNSSDSRAGIYNRVEGFERNRDDGRVLRDENGLPVGEPAKGDSGGIIIAASDSLTLLNDSRITTTTAGDGESGTISIVSEDIDLTNSELSAESFSTREAGSINISSAERVTLSNTSRIDADASSANGGNVTFKEIGILLLRDNSQILAASGDRTPGGGSGGNIRIFETNFVVTVPEGNNDILANAFGGNGGNIEMRANRIIGFFKRPSLQAADINELSTNGISDISASSNLGLPGQVVVDNLAIDPAQGLNELPLNLSDSSEDITEGCRANRPNIADASDAELSVANDENALSETERVSRNGRFTVTGRGGLPPTPSDPATIGVSSVPWVRPSSESTSQVSPISQELVLDKTPVMLAAQGWETRADGQVVFVAEPTSTEAFLSSTLPKAVSCSAATYP